MNEFPVDLQLTPSAFDHKGIIQLVFVRPPASQQVAILNGLVEMFREACALGLLSGAFVSPQHSDVNEFRREFTGAGIFKAQFDLQGVDGHAFRVLVKLLRGEPSLDGVIGSLAIRSKSGSFSGSAVSIGYEEEIGLPKMYANALPFEVIKSTDGRANVDRLVRVRLHGRPSRDFLDQLIHIGKVWVAMGKGGWVSAPKQAHECFTFADDGYLVSPKTFEICVDAFANPETYFDPLLNGLIKFSLTKQSIKVVHIQ